MFQEDTRFPSTKPIGALNVGIISAMTMHELVSWLTP